MFGQPLKRDTLCLPEIGIHECDFEQILRSDRIGSVIIICISYKICFICFIFNDEKKEECYQFYSPESDYLNDLE